MKRILLLVLAAPLLMSATAAPKSTAARPAAATSAKAPATAATSPAKPPMDAEHYLDQFIDKTADPRQDFFQYSVGKWLKENPIPTAERSWGIAKVVQEETYQRLLDISKTNAADPKLPHGTNAQKIGDFWYAAMDTVAISKQGLAPLKPEFARIDSVADLSALLAEISHLQYLGVNVMCFLGVGQDEKNSDRYRLHFYQGGLGLPNRDYYFDTDDRSTMLRAEYDKHLVNVFQLLGDAPETAAANAKRVYAIEKELAGASRKLEALRDPQKNYNPYSVEALSTLTPSIRWREFLENQTIKGVDSVIVGQPEFFQQVEKSIHGHSIHEWQTYLRWHLFHTYAEQAGGKYDDENFHFYGTILNGTKSQRPRFKRMLDQEENYLGDALGQLYVAQYFSPRTKERYEKLTDEIFRAFAQRIRNLDWMTDLTKDRALNKLNAVTKKVGYPTKWKDYSKLEIDRTSFLGNCIRANQWSNDWYIAKLPKPVDRLEWDMTPQTYNAYYNPSNNEIVLPAAIFILPGIADSLVDDAVVYAYAGGTTIGHEITHGFDDEGRQFDEKGNLVNWWQPTDEKEFNRRAALIVNQFNGYVVVDTMHCNGSATQGENIADLGGMVLGWDAFQRTDQYRLNKTLGGLTPGQRYFVGWSLGWMNALRPENLALRVKTDVHAPSFLRVTGPASNLPAFYEAFGVKAGDKMFRGNDVRVKIW
jgi:putative endopeptidase